MSTQRGCLASLFDFITGRRETTGGMTTMPKVRINKYFVSNAEADFFRVLTRVVGAKAHVLAQVSLRQLLWLPGSNQSNLGRATWQNKIAAKSVDFLLCDPSTLKPKLVIELDEPSHARPERQTRDDDVHAVLEAAGLPLIHVLTARAYDTRELAAALSPYLGCRS
jgi:very-short-patch-repair endonuclease